MNRSFFVLLFFLASPAFAQSAYLASSGGGYDITLASADDLPRAFDVLQKHGFANFNVDIPNANVEETDYVVIHAFAVTAQFKAGKSALQTLKREIGAKGVCVHMATQTGPSFYGQSYEAPASQCLSDEGFTSPAKKSSRSCIEFVRDRDGTIRRINRCTNASPSVQHEGSESPDSNPADEEDN